MKEKLALVIAALLITSMALSIPTTSVSAQAGASATISPTEVKDATRIKLTITVTNLTDDNIDNVLIRAYMTGQDFTQAIGGYATAENLKLAALLMENAVAPLKRAGENIKLAADNTADAGVDLAAAGASLASAATTIAAFSPGWDNNVSVNLSDAATYLDKAGDNMALETENLLLIENLLLEAYLSLDAAAGSPGGENFYDMWAYNVSAAENLDNAAAKILAAATELEAGSLRQAGENLENAGIYLSRAGTDLRTDSTTAGAAMESAGTSLQTAGLNLKDAAQFDNLAGIDLVKVADNLELVASYIRIADSDLNTAADAIDLDSAEDNADVASSFKRAGDNLRLSTDNILQAGSHLKLAVDNLNTAATELGAALGGDSISDMMVSDNHAADNLDDRNMVDLKVAGEQLIAAGTALSAAASTILSTANAIAPTTWNVAADTTNDVRFAAIGENYILPNASETFTFLWKMPDISIENTYTLRISLYKTGDVPLVDPVNGYVDVTLTIDGQVPILTIYVTQAGITDKNLVGNVLDNGRATIHIFSSEALQSIGKVYIENSGGTEENFLPPIENTALTKVSDTYYKYEYLTVENWDDNTPVVRVTSAKDTSGRENTASMENGFTVDTRAPILDNSGLVTMIYGSAGMRENVVQAGTSISFRYVDNTGAKALSITATDNGDPTGVNVSSVTIDWGTNSASAVRDPLVDNLWSLDPFTLSDGYTSIITVTATDRVGHTIWDNIENIFIDSAAPTITFDTIAGVTWTSGVLINDNAPVIKITVTDPGYPTSGLGVARPARHTDNFRVTLDNDDNVLNSTPYLFAENLENKDVWNSLTGVFENLLDNAGLGLISRTYYVNVVASDNLEHAGWLTTTASRTFKIDVTPPSATDITIQGWTAALGTIDSPIVLRTATRTIVVTIPTAEIGGTIKVIVNGEVKVTETMTTATKSIDIPLSAGVTNIIELTLTDVSANESGKMLYGYLMVDTTGPTVSITAPEADLTTDAASISLEATVTKDAWETYAELIVRIDATSLIAPIEAANALSTDGKLARAIGLVEGTNTITISAQDAAGNWSTLDSVTVTRTVTPWATYAIIIVIVAMVLSAIAIFRKR